MKSEANLIQPTWLINNKLAIILLAALASFSTGASADDTEVFFGQNTSQANVLFVVDVSGSMGHIDDGETTTRLDRLKTALKEIISTTSNINVGLMSYTGSGNQLPQEVRPITENRAEMEASIDALVAGGVTPTVGALFEGGQYFRGEPLMGSGQTYTSPMESACQSNHIVLLTDGSPTEFDETEKAVAAAIYGNDTTLCPDATLAGGTCGAELSKYLYDTDHSTELTGTNNIVTHTIGFNFSADWLPTVSSAASNDGTGTSTGTGTGLHFNAESASDLVIAFDSILEVANDSSNTFVAPAITLDQFTRFSHRDDMYLALFQPSNNQRWTGNLKRYRFDGQVKDKNGDLALDTSTGSFLPGAKSFWLKEVDVDGDGEFDPDGGDVALGGAAHLFQANKRNVYTYTGSSNDLTDSSNIFHQNNSAVTADILGVPTNARTNLIKWARGVDVDNETEGSRTRLTMGDPLHSRPAILTYGGTEAVPDSVVFIGTNEGFLHAINSSDGEEVFSFIPTDLLGNLNTYYQNERSINRLYGIDGDLTLWANDKDHNGKIDGSDHAYLYMGMRRGGSHYYALNVTNKTKPEFLWSVKGGPSAADGGDGTPGFEKLAQSWSKPTLSKVNVAGVEKDVLIFGGGYNPTLDHSNMRSPDDTGNDIFIIDATSGELIWNSATAADSMVDTDAMQYSIPSNLRIIDFNGDQLADQIYVGDMGGQVWRFDIDNRNTDVDSLVSGGVIANLSTDATVADNRRFFYPPDVALVENAGKRFLSVAIGSGNRAHPLDQEVKNRFYMIRQESINSAPDGYGIIDPLESTDTETKYRAVIEDDLYNTTENLIQSTDVVISDGASLALKSKAGWLLEMESSGEKVLASSLTVSNQIIFTSYLPETVTSDTCSPAVGSGRHYSVSVFDATPTNGTTPESRYSPLSTAGIPNEPTPFIDSDGVLTVLVNLDEVATPDYDEMTRVYWTEQPDY